MDFNQNSYNFTIDDNIQNETKEMLSSEQQHGSVYSDFLTSTESLDQCDKRIDFVLVCKGTGNNFDHFNRREEFEGALINQGLELEYEHNESFHFIKIHAPWEVLCRYSEEMKLKLPIKASFGEKLEATRTDSFDDDGSWFTRFFNFIQLDKQKFPKKETTPLVKFSRYKHLSCLTMSDMKNFFPANVRIMVVDFILKTQSVGIHRLLTDGVYSAAYPLHDGSYKQENTIRNLLYEGWALPKQCLKLQPLDTIQEYFGASIAIYFAWLGYYTFMLIPASAFGLLCFFYGVFTLNSNSLVQEACSSWAENVIMCPKCDQHCDYWRLNETCISTKITVLFDNLVTVFFAVFMLFWGPLCLELWKRKSKELTYQWGLMDWDQKTKHSQPEYSLILYQSNFIRSFWKVCVPVKMLTFSFVFLFVLAAFAVTFSVILLRMALFASSSFFGLINIQHKTYTIKLFAAAISYASMLVLGYLYNWIAARLTNIQEHQTPAEFDDSLNKKIYIFQFVNNYAPICYVVFFKGKFVGNPGNYYRFLNYRQEECDLDGCLMEIGILLILIMFGKKVFYIAKDIIYPVLVKWWKFDRTHFGNKNKDSRSRWIKDLKLRKWRQRGLRDEYLETVIQFGFITNFAVAFPLAPLLALASNGLRIRLDAMKFLRYYRRPVPQRARDMGIWESILHDVVRILTFTNAFIISCSSNFIPQLYYMYAVNPNHTDTGFLNHSLAYFDTKDFPNNTAPLNSTYHNVTMCRYSKYRNFFDYPESLNGLFNINWELLTVQWTFFFVILIIVNVLVDTSIKFLLKLFWPEQIIIPEAKGTKAKEEISNEYQQSINLVINDNNHLRMRIIGMDRLCC